MVGKIYAEILVDRLLRVTEGLTDDEQGGFRSGREYVDQIFTREQISEKAREKTRRMYVGFMDLEKAYDRVNKKALWQVLKMNDMGAKLLNGIKSIHLNSLACVRVKGGDSGCFRIDSGMRQGCVMSPWLFILYIDAVMKKVKMRMGRMGVRLLEKRRERRLLGLLYVDD